MGAEEYLAYDAPRALYWAYWDAPEAWRSDDYPFDMYLAHRGEHIRSIFQTDHGQLLIGSLPPVEEARSWRKRPLDALRESLVEDPVIAPLVEGREPDGKVRGVVKERYFFRQAAGPGWALVGDAGHHKDYVIGDGITEALRQARSLADAIQQGTDRALERWWRARDVEALPFYYWAREDGAVGPPGHLQEAVVRRVGGDPDLRRLMPRLPEHECSPYELIPFRVLIPALFGCLMRGRLAVLREFVARGRRATEYQRELKKRMRLLEEVSA